MSDYIETAYTWKIYLRLELEFKENYLDTRIHVDLIPSNEFRHDNLFPTSISLRYISQALIYIHKHHRLRILILGPEIRSQGLLV